MRRLNVQTDPELAEIKPGYTTLDYSRHAILRAKQKGFTLPSALTLGEGSVVELETSDDGAIIYKAVVRVSYDSGNDLVLVIIPGRVRGTMFVKTAWLNRTDDNHATLCHDRLGRVA